MRTWRRSLFECERYRHLVLAGCLPQSFPQYADIDPALALEKLASESMPWDIADDELFWKEMHHD
jgi:hypothetical protein